MNKCEIKYAPKNINDVVFNNAENERRLKMIFQGFKTRHLFLSGTNGVGKNLIADLVVRQLTGHCPCLLIEDPIDKVMAKNDLYIYFLNALHLAKLASAVKYDRVVIVFHELDKYEKSLDKLWMVMDRLKDELLVIITTNYPMKFENAIRSRCAKFNFTRITPDDFHSRAQEILREEDLILPDADVLHYLKTMTISTSDMRDYYEVLDELLFMSRHQMSLPAIPTLPLLTIAK